MFMNRRKMLSAVASIPFVLGLGSAHAQESVLRVVSASSLSILDPVWTTIVETRNHGYMIYDTLFATDANGRIAPQMVASYSVSADKLVWNFKLRAGLAFHDGAPVTAEDVVASLGRWAKRDPMGQKMFGALQAAEADAADSFKLIFKEPYGAVLETLGKPSSLVPFIMPKRVAQTPADQQISEYVGSGPFVFMAEEFRPGQKAVYVKNGKYVPRAEQASGAAGGKVVRVGKVEKIFLKDPQTQVNALINNEVDLLESVPFEHYAAMQANPAVTVLNTTGGQFLLRFNHLVPPFNDVRIRHAAMLAMDQEAVLRTQIGVKELYKTCMSVYPCVAPYNEFGVSGFTEKPNFAKARQLLKEAGYDGTPIVLLHATDVSSLAKIPPVAAQLLRQAGFAVDLKSMDWGSVVARRAKRDPADKGGWNAFVTYWGTDDAMNPINYAPLTGNGQAGWFGWATDEKIEQLRDAYARSFDDAAKLRLAKDIQTRAFEIGAFAPLGELLRSTAYRKDAIDGLLTGSLSVYWGVSKK